MEVSRLRAAFLHAIFKLVPRLPARILEYIIFYVFYYYYS